LKTRTNVIFISILLLCCNDSLADLDFYQTQCRVSDNKNKCIIVIQEKEDRNLFGDGCIVGNGLILEANADNEYDVEEWNTTVYIKTLDIKKVLVQGEGSGEVFIKGLSCTSSTNYLEKEIISKSDLNSVITNSALINKHGFIEFISDVFKKRNIAIEPALNFKGFEYLVSDTKKYLEVSVSSNAAWNINADVVFARYLLLIENGKKSVIWSWESPDKLLSDTYEHTEIHGIFRVNEDIYYYLSNYLYTHDGSFELKLARPKELDRT
jgi:hypothetical protein